MKRVCKRLRCHKGAVLIETAAVVLVLMTLVIGMGMVAVQGHDWQNRGRVAREAADFARLYLEERSTLDADGVAALSRLAGDRLRVPPTEYRVSIAQVRRDPATGAYTIADEWVVGSYAHDAPITVVDPPAADAGIHAQGVVLPLDMGAEVLVVQAVSRFSGIFKGTQQGQPRRTWVVVPMDR